MNQSWRRAVTNWNYLKAFNREELEKMVPEGFTFKTRPWSHQLAAFLANITHEGFLNALDLGTGKTKVAIDTCRYLDFTNGNKKKIKVLYLCLNSAVELMRDEVLLHSDFSALCIRGSQREKWKLFNQKANFYIINYEGLRSLLAKKVQKEKIKYNEDTGETSLRKFNKQQQDVKLIHKLLKGKFNVLIIDESHTIKTSTSLIFKMLKTIAKQMEHRCLLTGTPFGNTLLDVWPQYYVIDFGETFGGTFVSFRNSYFEDKGYWGPLWKPTLSGKKYINKNLYNKAIRYNESECEELPEKVFRRLEYRLNRTQRQDYDSLVGDTFNHRTDDIKSKALTMREISSGFIATSDYIYKQNPKLDLLFDIIENVCEDHKVVVFTERIKSLEIIIKLLKKKKIQYRSLSGATKNKYEQYDAFQKNDKYRVMVANIKSGGASINLTAATYCVHYEHGGSVINYRQSLKRIHRGGQTKRCFFYSLIGKGTVEVGIYRDLQAGNDAFTSIVDGESAKAYLTGN